jgi:hypothetical protein
VALQDWDRRRAAGWLAVGAGTALMLPAAWGAAFHCDEINVLRHVTDFGRGDFDSPGRPGLLWFALLPLLALGEPAAIALAARAAAVLASAATLWGVWRLATPPGPDGRGIDPKESGWGAVSAVLLLATSMSWQAHSFEVRTDTWVSPLILAAAWLLLRERLDTRRAVGLGLIVAASGLLSQKSIYNAVALGLGWLAALAVGAWPLRPLERLRAVAIAATVALAVVVAWYAGMAFLSGAGAGFVSQNLDSAVVTAFAEKRALSTKLKSLGMAAQSAWPLYGLATLGIASAVLRGRRAPRVLAIAVLGLAMLSTVTVHRGYFMYFIASNEPYLAVPAGAALGLACDAFRRFGRAWAPVPLLMALAVASWVAAPQVGPMLKTSNAPQIAIMEEARRAFPTPVPYWDGIGLLPGYPETTFFGTGISRSRFRKSVPGPGFIQRARERKPRFFIREYMTRDRYWRNDERRWHWMHFLPYRPNLYLHGGRIRAPGGQESSAKVELLLSDDYTVWFRGGWRGEASVDGRTVQHREVIALSEGIHELRARPEGDGGQLWLLLGREREPYADETAAQRDLSTYPQLQRDRYQRYDRRGQEADLLSPDHDPTLSAGDRAARLARHRKWQLKRDQEYGRP